MWNANSQSCEQDRWDGENVPDRALELETRPKPWTALPIPLLNDASRVSCSAATAVTSKEDTELKSEYSPSNNKVIAPSLLGQHHPGTRAESGFRVRRRATLARMSSSKSRQTLESRYELNPEPIGEGAFGQVFVARDRDTGELVAVKKIWKEYSDNQDFVREMNALLQIRAHGGHPHISQLKENFDEPAHFALVLDLIKGGEMFEHLVKNGAYSELDGKT